MVHHIYVSSNERDKHTFTRINDNLGIKDIEASDGGLWLYASWYLTRSYSGTYTPLYLIERLGRISNYRDDNQYLYTHSVVCFSI